MSALAEMVPVPVIVFDATGQIVISNRLASRLQVVSSEKVERRVLAFDGADLWDIISARRRLDELWLTELPVRVRTAASRSADVTFVVSTLGGSEGVDGGVFVMAYDTLEERDAADQHPHPLDGSVFPLQHQFAPLVRLLAEELGADAAAFAEVDPDRPLSALTLAAAQDGQVLEGFEWSIAGTPILSAGGKRSVLVHKGLREAFPDDLWAAAEGFESFAAVFLFDADGRRVGILAAYSRDPIEAPEAMAGMLRLFAARLSPALRHLISTRSLHESEERYSSLFELNHMPMLLVDPASSQIVDANRAACDFYGYGYDELTTMSALQINTAPPEDVRSEMLRALEGTRDYFQFKHRLADGSVRDVEIYSGTITVHGRRLLSGIIHDVTERHRTEAELERYKQQLERLLERRTDDLMRTNVELQQTTAASDAFYENVGAEFRTPLHTIIGFSDMLSRGMAGDLNEEQQRQIDMVLGAGRHLAELVDDVLDLSRLATGVEVCEPSRFDVVELVQSIAVGAHPAAEARGLELAVEVPDGKVEVFTDRNKVEQVLLQLLANALKYTREGGFGIAVEASDEEVVVRVSDSGVGIDPAELPHIFEEFRQVARQVSGTHEGTGLGLALCRRLTHIIDGSLEAESQPGSGATFILRFPRTCP